MLRKDVNGSLPIYCANCGCVRLNMKNNCINCGHSEFTNEKPKQKIQKNGCLIGCLSFIIILVFLMIIGKNSGTSENAQQQTQSKVLTPAQEDAREMDALEKEYDKKLTPAQRAQEAAQQKADDEKFNKINAKVEKENKKMLNAEKYSVKAALDKLISKYECNGYYFYYYIDPFIWNSMNVDAKQGLLNTCAEYTSYDPKNKNRDKEDILRHTKIKDYANGEVIGEYITNGKYKFK